MNRLLSVVVLPALLVGGHALAEEKSASERNASTDPELHIDVQQARFSGVTPDVPAADADSGDDARIEVEVEGEDRK